MPVFAVVLIGPEGSLGGRQGLKVVQAEDARDAVTMAWDDPPSRDVKHAWVHELTGMATIIDVVVDDPKWGRARENVSA